MSERTIHSLLARGLAAVVGLALLTSPLTARAQSGAAASPGPVQLTGMRTWTSPGGTRVVFDFSAPVTHVSPDSGTSNQLVVAVPTPGISAAPGVPTELGLSDSAVSAVRPIFDANGVRFWIQLVPGATFRVFTLAADQDKPYRIVVDIQRPGAVAAEEKRFAAIAAGKKKTRTRLVVIDAGHGGEDYGARGPGPVHEKNVTLAIARRLADTLNNVPGVRAVLTRDGDFFIPLTERYKIAEKMKADLFVSIHCNSSRRRGRGSGSEVYFLSLKGASDQADQDLADAENAADIVGGVAPQAEDDVVGVLYEVKRNAMLERSQLLAETLLDHMAADRRVESRGIKQAGFRVLKSVEFPSALVETAFINNPREVLLLKNAAFQSRMANQLATGVRAYFGKAGITLAPSDSSVGSPAASSGSR
jgi:N-acetylmuramoyl-L-alanine amidase